MILVSKKTTTKRGDQVNLYDAMKKELKEKKISQAELARKLKQDRQSINKHLKKWKDGGVPTVALLKKWCESIGTDYKKFLPYL